MTYEEFLDEVTTLLHEIYDLDDAAAIKLVVDAQDADYYGEHLGRGGVLVSVDDAGGTLSRDELADILYRNGGHNTRRAPMAEL